MTEDLVDRVEANLQLARTALAAGADNAVACSMIALAEALAVALRHERAALREERAESARWVARIKVLDSRADRAAAILRGGRDADALLDEPEPAAAWRAREGLGPEKPVVTMSLSELRAECARFRRFVDYQARVFCAAHKPYGDEVPNGHGCPCCNALRASELMHVYSTALVAIEEAVEREFDDGDPRVATVRGTLAQVARDVAALAPPAPPEKP